MIREHRDAQYTLEVIRPFPGSISLPGDPKSWFVVKNEPDLITMENKVSGDSVGFSNGKIGHGYYSGNENEKDDNVGHFKHSYFEIWNSLHSTVPSFEIVVIEEQIDNIGDDFLMVEVKVAGETQHYMAIWINKPKIIKVFLTTKDERQAAIKKLVDMVESATGAKIIQQGLPENSLFADW